TITAGLKAPALSQLPPCGERTGCSLTRAQLSKTGYCGRAENASETNASPITQQTNVRVNGPYIKRAFYRTMRKRLERKTKGRLLERALQNFAQDTLLARIQLLSLGCEIENVYGLLALSIDQGDFDVAIETR